jgi:hypothetical protein
MRRVASALLLLVFSLPLMAPAILSAFASAPDDSGLPACCRRDGKHHCAMSMAMGNIPPRFRTASEKCPFSPFSHPQLMVPQVFALNTAQAAIGLASGAEAVVREAEAGYRISADRTRHKRGPPTFLSL